MLAEPAGVWDAVEVAFPENLLAQDERVVRHLHPHWLTVFLPSVLFILIVGIASFVIAVIPDGAGQDIWRIVVIALALLALVVFVLVPYLKWRTTHYVITSHRVILRTGVVNRHGKDIGLARITDVSFTQSLWDRVIRAGTLRIESAGEGPPQVLKNIPDSDETQQLLNHLVEEDSDSRARESAGYIADAYDDIDGTAGRDAPDRPVEAERRRRRR